MSANLSTSYLGFELENPIIASSSPLTATIDSLQRLADSGIAAAVLPSLFAEQVDHDEHQFAALLDNDAMVSAEASGYLPDMAGHFSGPKAYFEHIEAAKKGVAIPIIASINMGITDDGWLDYLRQMERAGADAIELNLYYVATDPTESAATIERMYADRAAAACAAVGIPVAAKIGPFFTALPSLARRLSTTGIAALVLFNRYLDPNVNLETMSIDPDLVLSDRDEIRLVLRWIATLRECLDLSLGATGGVHFAEDIIKTILVGADAVLVAAAIIRYGPRWVATTLDELRRWLDNKQYSGIAQMKGSMSFENCPDPTALHRVNYIKSLTSFTDGSI